MQVCSIVRACKDEHSTHLVEQIMKPINVVYCLLRKLVQSGTFLVDESNLGS